MDREIQLSHLKLARRHVAQGELHIAKQEDRIADLSRLGADTTEAQRFLNNLFALQIEHIAHRDRMLKALD
jgi:hypothetical protein